MLLIGHIVGDLESPGIKVDRCGRNGEKWGELGSSDEKWEGSEVNWDKVVRRSM